MREVDRLDWIPRWYRTPHPRIDAVAAERRDIFARFEAIVRMRAHVFKIGRASEAQFESVIYRARYRGWHRFSGVFWGTATDADEVESALTLYAAYRYADVLLNEKIGGGPFGRHQEHGVYVVQFPHDAEFMERAASARATRHRTGMSLRYQPGVRALIRAVRTDPAVLPSLETPGFVALKSLAPPKCCSPRPARRVVLVRRSLA